MADGKIYITISDTRGGSGAGVGADGDKKDDKKKSGGLGEYFTHRFRNFLEAQAKQAVNYTIGNIGNFTGNYQAQRDAQQAISLISTFVNLGSAFYTGTKTSGSPIGGAIAVAISAGSMLANAGYKEYSEWFQTRKDNRNIDMMRNRLGLQGLTDGSRTGGY